MGTRVDIILPESDDESADSVCLLLQNELRRIENDISIYIPESEFSRINNTAFVKPVIAGKEVFNLLQRLIVLSGETNDYFNFTLGKITHRKMDETSSQHDNEEQQVIAGKTVAGNISLNPEESSVMLSSEHISLDSGGFGKGFGLDQVKKVMNNTKFNSYFVSFGESSVLAQGTHPYGDTWKTGIRNIFKEDDYICCFNMKDEFLSVSGITPQNIKKYGKGHIVNPATGKPVTELLHVAVKGQEGLTTEVLSTALMVAPDDARNSIMNNFPDYSAVIYKYDTGSNKPEILHSINF